MVSHCNSTFAVWHTLTSTKEQRTNILEKESSGDESDQACFMVQENDSLEVNSVGPEIMINAELSLLATMDLQIHKSTQN